MTYTGESLQKKNRVDLAELINKRTAISWSDAYLASESICCDWCQVLKRLKLAGRKTFTNYFHIIFLWNIKMQQASNKKKNWHFKNVYGCVQCKSDLPWCQCHCPEWGWASVRLLSLLSGYLWPLHPNWGVKTNISLSYFVTWDCWHIRVILPNRCLLCSWRDSTINISVYYWYIKVSPVITNQ